ncbi:MAG TPA: hypothetical protein VFF17_09070 [Thermoanaerobaculia bacterium]|nr:hypothetical protein [Thermoanaerobaculia bacterium]
MSASLVMLLLASSLAYAAPPSSSRPFRVIDRNGALVGHVVTENLVAREISGTWVTFYVHAGFGIYDSNAIYLHYTTTDCRGAAYIPHSSMFAEGTRVGSRLYYPADQQVLTPQSHKLVYGSGEEGPCYAAAGIADVYGTAASANVDSFGLALPFRAVQ